MCTASSRRVGAGAKMENDWGEPREGCTAPTPSKSRVKAFTPDQVTQLLAAAERDPETYIITALFLACGLRRSEVSASLGRHRL